MKFLGSTKIKMNKDKYNEDVPNLEIADVVLDHCNILNNNCQQNTRVLCTFVPTKSFGQLLDISPTDFTFLKTFKSEIEAWFTDQNSKLPEMDDKINITLTVNPIQDGLFWGCSWLGGEWAISPSPLPKICRTDPAMIKPGTVIPSLKKIQKI